MGPDFVPTHLVPDNRFPGGPDRYPPPPRYPPNKFNEVDRYPAHPYPDDYDREKYPSHPIDSMENNKFNNFYGNRVPSRYPSNNRYTPNNIPYDDGFYPDKHGMYPDTRNPPNRGHHVDRPRPYPDFHPPMMSRPMDGRYGNIPSYYEQSQPDMYNIRYPDLPENKYIPWGTPNMYETRFHIGMNRIPMYGSQGRFPIMSPADMDRDRYFKTSIF